MQGKGRKIGSLSVITSQCYVLLLFTFCHTTGTATALCAVSQAEEKDPACLPCSQDCRAHGEGQDVVQDKGEVHVARDGQRCGRDGMLFESSFNRCEIGFFTLQLSKCDVCQHMNRKLTTGTPHLNPIPVKAPWHMVGIDFVGPLSPIAEDGSQFIFTIADYFTKWVDAIA